jgi:threonine dehydratase
VLLTWLKSKNKSRVVLVFVSRSMLISETSGAVSIGGLLRNIYLLSSMLLFCVNAT